MRQEFYKPEPIPPEKSQIARALRWSLRLSVAGWIVYGLFAFAFADIGIVPAWVQSALVLIGSALIIAGGEANTIPTGVAALSKLGTDRFSAWDATAFIASFGGSLFSGLITFSTRQTELAGTVWRQFAITQGPLWIGVAYTLDMYGALAELGLAKRDYELDWAQWWDEKLEWDAAQPKVEQTETTVVQAEPKPDPVDYPAARKPDFERVLGRLNGERATLTADELEAELAKDHLGLPSGSTVKRWLKIARRG